MYPVYIAYVYSMYPKYVYIYLYICVSVYIYICIYMCVCECIYTYIYIYPAYIHIHRITMYPNLNSRENMLPKLGKSSSLTLREWISPYLHFTITFPIVWWWRTILREIAKVPAGTRTYLPVTRGVWSCWGLAQPVTFTGCAIKPEPGYAGCLLYYRLRTLEGSPDHSGSWEDATRGRANTQCAQADFWWLMEI